MDVFAEIIGIKYTPFLCKNLQAYDIKNLSDAFNNDATFLLNFSKDKQIAVSWWVSAKRTRSYPYARVYDTLSFQGKKVTIIPIIKDEGREGDRDFLQWDTISLMSLLGVYTIISYYDQADKSSSYDHKITNQRFNLNHLQSEFTALLSYQSDALHWNLSQIDKVGEIGQKALDSYTGISKRLRVEMHSSKSAEKRIQELLKGKLNFMSLSRGLAQKAQNRESVTIQPKEKLSGIKATLTIKNYLGGYYYFTSDEVIAENKSIYLIEGKHTKTDSLPSSGDIKDGLLKMILFTNLENVRMGEIKYVPIPILKLTTGSAFKMDSLGDSTKEMLNTLKKEATENNFKVIINDTYL